MDDSFSVRNTADMPQIDLSDSELQNAAQAARVAAAQAECDAARQTNPGTRKLFEQSARTYLALSTKFEAERIDITSASKRHF